MTIGAVQAQVQTLLSGLAVPGYAQPMRALVKVPVPDKIVLGQPLAFIWGGAGNRSRMALPRENPAFQTSVGWKGNEHQLGIWVYAVSLANADTQDPFPAAIEAICGALEAAVVPARVADPVTGSISYLVDLGERISWEYDIDRTIGDQRTVRSLCHLEASCLESFQA